MKHLSLLALFCFTSSLCMDNPNPALPPLTEYYGWTAEKMEAAWQEFQPLLAQYKTDREALSLDDRNFVAQTLDDQQELQKNPTYGRCWFQLTKSEKQQELLKLDHDLSCGANPNQISKATILKLMHFKENPIVTHKCPSPFLSHIWCTFDDDNLPLTQTFLKHGAHVNPDIRWPYHKHSPLFVLIHNHVSEHSCPFKTIELLLSHGADPNWTDKHPKILNDKKPTVPLHEAWLKNNVTLFKLLLKYKANPSAIINTNKETLLHKLPRSTHTNLTPIFTRLLLQAGASLEAKDKDNITPAAEWSELNNIWQKIQKARAICGNTFAIIRRKAPYHVAHAVVEYVYNNMLRDSFGEKNSSCTLQLCPDTDAFKAICTRMKRPFNPHPNPYKDPYAGK